jgi:hypothetical protein
MAEAALAVAPVVDLGAVRRFELPDLDYHVSWFMARFLKAYPHLNERQAIGMLRSVIYQNDYMMLFHDNGVALAQTMSAHALDANPVIWERFVWARDPKNPSHVAACAQFYDRFKTWAKNQGINIIHVEESSDVPRDMIKERLGGRLMETVQRFARL